MTERADWDETWLRVAAAVAARSDCVRGQVGAVIVDATNRVVATGYNGPPAHLRADHPYRGDRGPVVRLSASCAADCPRARAAEVADPVGYTDCISIHAESNALLFCDRRDREDGTLYVTSPVCFTCAKLVANSGVARVVAVADPERSYRDPDRSLALLRASGLRVHVQELPERVPALR